MTAPLSRRVRVRAFLPVAAGLGLLTLAGCGGASSAASSGNGGGAAAQASTSTSSAASGAAAGTITVTATEFSYSPSTITLQAGQKVTLTINNAGKVDHDIKSDIPISGLTYTQADNDPDEQKDNSAKGVFDVDFNAGHSATVSFIPTTPGTYTFHCDEPGHTEAGMTGTFVVH